MYAKIMVPLDGSELAECVFPHLETIAKGCGVKNVTFVRVVEPFRITTGDDVVFSEEYVKKCEADSKAAAKNYLDGLVGKLSYSGVSLRSEVLFGRPADMLVDYAKKKNPDLIIIATHGRSGVSRWVWGSVADRILRAACVPVLMIRAPGCVSGI
jgi:nucleotide-binding universal stress UspA family protein